MNTQNPLTTDYDFTDALKLLKQEIFLSLNCHAIGTVQSFQANSVNGSASSVVGQTATATINYQRTFFRINPSTQAYESYLLPYPLLVACPVICLGGGSASLTFPISAGDECLILFNDRNIDHWFTSNGGGAPATGRLHSFTDAIILVGIRSSTKVIHNYDTSRAVLRNGDPTSNGAMVGVGPVKVKVANNITTLNTLLQNLVTQIENLCTATAAITVITSGTPGSAPVNAAAITAVSSALSTLATQIGGLLE